MSLLSDIDHINVDKCQFVLKVNSVTRGHAYKLRCTVDTREYFFSQMVTSGSLEQPSSTR